MEWTRHARRGASPPRQPLGPPRSGRRALLGAALGLAACASETPDRPGPAPRGRVVLLRGIFNVFSTGLDDLGVALRAAGYEAEVYNHIAWPYLAEEIARAAQVGRLPRPLALAGHSLGADDALRLAGALGEKGLRVDLVVTYDTVLVDEVPAGPRQAVNYYQTGGTWGVPLRPAPGFDGAIENIALPPGVATHSNIDENRDLHADTLARLRALTPARPPSG